MSWIPKRVSFKATFGMMRRTLVFLFVVLNGWACAGDLPWMGVSLHSLESKEKSVSILPEGVGFEVSRVIAGGPVDQAGGRKGDFWWKFDDQILINKSQMVVLLRTKKPGEKVRVDFYREGELRQLVLILGNRETQRLIPVSFREGKSDEARVLARRERVARVRIDESDLSLESEGDLWRFKVREDGVTVLSALVGDQGFQQQVPVKWHQAFMILRTTLGDSPDSSLTEVQRRVRHFPRARAQGSNE